MTAGSVRGSASVSVQGTYPPPGVTGSLKNISVRQTLSAQMTGLTFGTTSGKCDLIVCRDVTLTATTAATYDLYTGADLPDLNGLTAALRGVKTLAVSVVSGGDGSGVRLGGAASNAWAGFFADASDMHLLFPGGLPYLAGSPAGVAVGATTKNLKVENLGAVSVTIRILIAGTSV